MNTRQVKLTLYLDVPTLDENNNFIDSSKIIKICENSLKQNKFYVNAPSEIILGPIESDDLEAKLLEAKRNNDNVVGFLAPDAKWYLMFCSEDNLAHIKLADILYPYYKYELGYTFIDGNDDLNLDFILEKNGFIKVHGVDIRYFSNIGPKINDKQIEELIKYIRLQNKININEDCINPNKIYGMYSFQFNKLFEL